VFYQIPRYFLNLVFSSTLVLLFGQVKSQWIFQKECFGVIESGKTNTLKDFRGSGFVIDSNIVITCYHVYRDTPFKPKYFANLLGTIYPIRIIDSLPSQDIAIYKSKTTITRNPLRIVNSKNVNVGDSIIYIGYDAKAGEHIMSKVAITNINSIVIKNSPVLRISFSGSVIGGYSGGPVLNANDGLVEALVVQVVGLKDRRTGLESTNVVCYSLDPIFYIKKGRYFRIK
jgi:S1-C subfamily serine protease